MHPTKIIKGTKSKSLEGKTIVMGITGCIGAVKCVELARELIRQGAEVFAVMSKEARRIIHPNAMHYATGNPVITKLTGAIEHVEFCGGMGKADLLLIAPCTANTLGKIAQGIDDTVVTSFAATMDKGKILIVPAMHGTMYENPFLQRNLKLVVENGISFFEPKDAEGIAKVPETEEIVLECERILGKGLLEGKKVLIANGATQEDIDGVRVLTNRASGKTGIEIAKECYRQGAEVCTVHNLEPVSRKIKNLKVRTNKEMEKTVLEELEKGYDLYITPAAVGDFEIERIEGKIKKPVELKLKPRARLADLVREKFPKLEIVAFKAEVNVSEKELLERAKQKMKELNAKCVVANDVKEKGLGTEDNEVIILSQKGEKKVSGSKAEIAKALVEEIARLKE